MKNNKLFIPIILLSIYLVLFMSMIIASIHFGIKNSSADETINCRKIKNVTATINEKKTQHTLPYKFQNLKKRTKINITFKLDGTDKQFIYIKTVYAPLKVYCNNELIYSYGQPDSYPNFLKDPPTKTKILELPKSYANKTITLEYQSPKDRSSLMIHPLLHGDYNSIRKTLINDMGFTFILAIANVIIGILLLFISFIALVFDKKSISFLWLGVFSVLTGIFSIGECNLSQLYTSNATLLYIMDFCAFFALPIPLIEFAKSMMHFKHKKILDIAQTFQTCTIIICFLLQIFSIKSLYCSLYIFIVLSPITLILLSTTIIKEALEKNEQSKIFIIPMSVVALASVVEAINYKFRFIATLSSCFMIGVLIFIILLSIQCSVHLHYLISLNTKNRILEYELTLKENQIQAWQDYNKLIKKNTEILKLQRHDFKHQLALIQHYIQTDNKMDLTTHINKLLEHIPTEQSMTYCENEAINAILIYYMSIIEDKNITTDIQLCIPDNINHNTNNDICIIIGNLLENAIESCIRDNYTKNKFIKLYSKIHYDTLTITLDNSFNGEYTKKDDMFLSSKRNDYGIGLYSIEQISKRYNGNCRFEPKDYTFLSSVYLKI